MPREPNPPQRRTFEEALQRVPGLRLHTEAGAQRSHGLRLVVHAQGRAQWRTMSYPDFVLTPTFRGNLEEALLVPQPGSCAAFARRRRGPEATAAAGLGPWSLWRSARARGPWVEVPRVVIGYALSSQLGSSVDSKRATTEALCAGGLLVWLRRAHRDRFASLPGSDFPVLVLALPGRWTDMRLRSVEAYAPSSRAWLLAPDGCGPVRTWRSCALSVSQALDLAHDHLVR